MQKFIYMKQNLIDFFVFITSLAAFICLVCWFPSSDDNFSEWEASRAEKRRLQLFYENKDTICNKDVFEEHAMYQEDDEYYYEDDEYYTADIDCYACTRKPGACPFCNGNTYLTNPVTLNSTPCPYCNASGNCSVCKGSGTLPAIFKKNVSKEERERSTEQLNQLYQAIKEKTDESIRQSQDAFDKIVNTTRENCPYCHGRGYEPRYIFGAEAFDKTWCERCQKYDYIHSDVICPLCKNKD